MSEGGLERKEEKGDRVTFHKDEIFFISELTQWQMFWTKEYNELS